MTKQWLDGSELKFDGKETTPIHNSDLTKTDDKSDSVSDTSADHTQITANLADEGKQSPKSLAVKDSFQMQSEAELQRRGRGRPKKGDATVYQPAPQIDRNKRVTKELAKQTIDDSNTLETIQTPLLVLYDHIHDNVREAIT